MVVHIDHHVGRCGSTSMWRTIIDLWRGLCAECAARWIYMPLAWGAGPVKAYREANGRDMQVVANKQHAAQ